MQGEKKKKAITAIQVVLGLLIVAGIAWLVFKGVGYHQSQQIYREIESAYANETPGESGSPVDFAALQQEYPDIVGWLKVDDVDISYPIVQGKDNDFYLHHDPSGAYNDAGSVFLDYRNNSFYDDLHALVYAHNRIDESMFGPLDNFVEESFFQNGLGGFTIYTPDATYRYQIFAADIVYPTDEAYQVGFNNTQVFDAYVKTLKQRSMYETGVEVSGSDHIVTLSTCSGNNRLVLSGKRIEG